MIRITVILVAAMAFAGCQGAGLCNQGLFGAYAAPVAQDDSVWMANSPDIRLTRKVYDKNLDWCSLGEDWLTPYQPVTASENDTYYMPSFLGTDAFMSRSVTLMTSINESEDDWLTASSDFALTRRLGFSAALPINLTDEDVPFGRVGGRALLLDTQGFLLSTNLSVDFSSTRVDWTPTLNGWYDLAGVGLDHTAAFTTIGGRFLEDRDDQFLWTGGLSHSFGLGETGRWEGILETGYVNEDWILSFGVQKDLEFLHPDLSARAAIQRNFDTDNWSVLFGMSWDF